MLEGGASAGDLVSRRLPPPDCVVVASSEAVIPAGTTASSRREDKCTGLHWDSSSGDGDTCLSGYRPHRQLVCRQAYSRPLLRMQTVPSLVIAQLAAHCVFVLKTPSRVIEKRTVTGSTLGACNSPARRAGGKCCWPTSDSSCNRCDRNRTTAKAQAPSMAKATATATATASASNTMSRAPTPFPQGLHQHTAAYHIDSPKGDGWWVRLGQPQDLLR